MKLQPPYILLLASIVFFNVTYSPFYRTGEIDTVKIVEATNQARAKAGLAGLSENDALDRAASDKALDMELGRYFAHKSPQGISPWDWIAKNNYVFMVAGENLAINYNDTNDLMKAWLESPSHRENILNSKFKDVGIGVRKFTAKGKSYTLIVQMFGSPQRLSVR